MRIAGGASLPAGRRRRREQEGDQIEQRVLGRRVAGATATGSTSAEPLSRRSSGSGDPAAASCCCIDAAIVLRSRYSPSLRNASAAGTCQPSSSAPRQRPSSRRAVRRRRMPTRSWCTSSSSTSPSPSGLALRRPGQRSCAASRERPAGRRRRVRARAAFALTARGAPGRIGELAARIAFEVVLGGMPWLSTLARPTAGSAPTSPPFGLDLDLAERQRPLGRLDLAAVERDLEIGSADLDAERAAPGRPGRVDELERRSLAGTPGQRFISASRPRCRRAAQRGGIGTSPARAARTRHRFLATLGQAGAGGLDHLCSQPPAVRRRRSESAACARRRSAVSQ